MFVLLFPPPFFLAYGMAFLKAATAASTDVEKEGEENPVLLYVNDDGGAGAGADLERDPAAADEVNASGRLSGGLSGEVSARLSAKLDNSAEEGRGAK